MGDITFGEKLKKARQDAGFTQKDIYEELGVPQSTFSSWEIGKSEPSADILVRLCELYGIESFSYFKGMENRDTISSSNKGTKEAFAIDFYDKVEKILLGKNLNKKQLAMGIGIPYTTLMSTFKRRPKAVELSTIVKMAKYLDVSVDYLVNDENYSDFGIIIDDFELAEQYGYGIDKERLKEDILEATANRKKKGSTRRYSGIREDGAYVENVPQGDVDKIIKGLSMLPKEDIDALNLFMQFLIYKNQNKQ